MCKPQYYFMLAVKVLFPILMFTLDYFCSS